MLTKKQIFKVKEHERQYDSNEGVCFGTPITSNLRAPFHTCQKKEKFMISNVVQKGDYPIGEIARPVQRVQSEIIQSIITNLIDSMRYHNLVGMAAPQIGQCLRIFVIEVRETLYRKDMGIKEDLKVFINPEIVSHSEEENTDYEGCGSVEHAGIFGPVKRWNQVTVQALDKDGSPFEYKAEGFLARVVQHEYDHLNGVLFIDKVTNVKEILTREEYIKKFRS